MKRTNRFSYVTAVNFLMLGIFLAGCIVVVKEDDDRRRRYLRDSEWTLEVVFYRAKLSLRQIEAFRSILQKTTRLQGWQLAVFFQGSTKSMKTEE